MEYERKAVTINWQIENVKFPHQQEMKLHSPVFSVDVMDRTKWKLGMFLLPVTAIRLTLKREMEDKGPEEIGLHYEFSIIPTNVLCGNSSNRKWSSFRFLKDQSCPEVELTGKPKYRFNGSITIQCKMWKQLESIPMNGHFFLRTRIKTERCAFIGVIEHFSDFPADEKKTLKTILSPTGEVKMTINLYLSRLPRYSSYYNTFEGDFPSGNCCLKIAVDNTTENVFDLQLFILDFSGQKSNIGKLEREFTLGSSVKFILHDVFKEELLTKAAMYLPNDILSLQCELTLFSEKEYEEVERIEYETDSLSDVKQTDFTNELEFLTRREGIPCDTKLHTVTETFPAHTAILSAKSPVFEAMFASKMKEADEKCVQIDDVDAETVKRMLVFLYSGKVDELEWKDAKELYFAADKYQLLHLKSKCVALLSKSVDLSNCIVLLLLADMHQDKDLKRVVQDYITQNGEKILYSDQWKTLEKNHPQLAINYFRELYETLVLPSRLFQEETPSSPKISSCS
ncbi:unnamed protein product [Larinioides sclopetarius]|uniref:BTB domain-containing protein n=1 Tax=Larinioides sclopetarius TaxID=280406 RepID=A0AAV2AWS3_9ARAC